MTPQLQASLTHFAEASAAFYAAEAIRNAARVEVERNVSSELRSLLHRIAQAVFTSSSPRAALDEQLANHPEAQALVNAVVGARFRFEDSDEDTLTVHLTAAANFQPKADVFLEHYPMGRVAHAALMAEIAAQASSTTP